MSFSIENYSVLNNYNYEGKSFLSSSLDWLSTPYRRILGGRNICVLSQTYENKMSTAGKIATVFFSVLIFPVAIVSIASLIIKMTTFPWVWEEKKVKVQSQQTWDAINQFNRAFKANNYDKAIQTFSQRPEVGKRNDVYNDFFRAINQKINDQSSWEEVQIALPFLNSNDAIKLINHAVKMKLSYEFKDACNLTSATHIINFIQNSLSNRNIQNLEACYKKLFSDALQIDVDENILFNAIKMDIADQLIKCFVQIKTSHAENELERASAKLEGVVLRYSLFKKEQDYTSHYLIFSSIDSMQKVSAIVQEIRHIHQIGWQSLNKLNALSAKCNTNEQEQWEAIYSVFKEFKINLNQLTLSGNEEEKTYVLSLQRIFDDMIEFIESIRGLSSAEEIQSCVNNLEMSLAEQTKNFPNLFANTKISRFETHLNQLLSTLRLKKNVDLFAFTEKLKSIMLKNMVQQAIAL